MSSLLCSLSVCGIKCLVLIAQESRTYATSEVVKRCSSYLDQLGGTKPALGKTLVAAAKQKAGDAATRGKLDVCNASSLADARIFMPHGIVGCNLQLVKPTTNTRTGYCPNCIPGSRSRTLGATRSKERVLRAVLQWVWSQHTIQTSEPCPFNFEKIVFIS